MYRPTRVPVGLCNCNVCSTFSSVCFLRRKIASTRWPLLRNERRNAEMTGASAEWAFYRYQTIYLLHFYQRVSIASYANRWYSQRRHVRLSVRPSVRPSVTLRYCIKTKKASVMISSPSESLNILVSRNIWFIAKFDRGHPEWGRFLRLGWVRTGDFGDFSTNKPPYLRNGAR